MTADDNACKDRHHHVVETRIAVLEERVKNRDEALKLQAKEYERRLSDLNHAHAQAQEKNAEYLPRNEFDLYAKALNAWQSTVDIALAKSQGKNSAYVSIVALLLAFGALIATYIN